MLCLGRNVGRGLRKLAATHSLMYLTNGLSMGCMRSVIIFLYGRPPPRPIGLFLILPLFFLSGYPVNVLARSPKVQSNTPSHPIPVDTRYPGVLTSRPLSPVGAKADSIYILGGPDRDDGDFQDASGRPDWDGWTSVDVTVPPTIHWTIDTYNAQVLDPLTVPNHAWWCGTEFANDCGTGDFRGYGNNWNEQLDWNGATGLVLDDIVVNVRVTAHLSYDLEPGYDVLHLQYEDPANPGQMVTAFTFSGSQVDAVLDLGFTVYFPAGYSGPDDIHLRWQFFSDSGHSDEDCSFPTMGAAQIDRIQVLVENVPVGILEDCEDRDGDGSYLDDAAWVPNLPQGVGDFAKIWVGLEDLDPCRTNNSPQVAFIDDGLVVPGTEGYHCVTWCYGPGGYIVNPEGGLKGPDFHIQNEIWSPPIPWPGDNFDGAVLSFDVYRHEDLIFPTSPGMFWVWHVRDTIDPEGDGLWHQWQDKNFVYYGGPEYTRYTVDVSNHLEPDKTFVQVALGVYELGWVWGYVGTDGTPAPYFDNVALVAFDSDPLFISAKEIELAQDAFPQIGIIDYGNPGNNSVRFDMARNISFPEHLRNDPGDSIVVEIHLGQPGSQLLGDPRLFYRLFPNPVFDVFRTSGLPNAGSVTGMETFDYTGGLLPGRWNFDLPDQNFLFPGDVLHYYLRAEDDMGGVAVLPPDTTGFGAKAGSPSYAASFTVHALPTLLSMIPGDQPPILFWDDFGYQGGHADWRPSDGSGGLEEWTIALQNLGYRPGLDYDLYSTNGASSGVGNGLGGRATTGQLGGYRTILYSCGDLEAFTITEQDFTLAGDAGDDVGVFDGWLRTGSKNLLLTGDNLVYDLNKTLNTQAFVDDWLGVSVLDGDVYPEIGNQTSPRVRVLPDNDVFVGITEWALAGACPGRHRFDRVEANTDGVRLAEFLDPAGGTGAYNHSAATLFYSYPFDANVISLPYDLMSVVVPPDKAPDPSSDRTRLLEDVLTYFDEPPGGSPSRLPDLDLSLATTAAGETVSIFTLGDGSGDPLTAGRTLAGPRTDATITLTLKDALGKPIPGYPKEDLWLATSLGGLMPMPGGSCADHDTDDLGVTTFSQAIRGWGVTDLDGGELTRVMIGGSPLNGSGLPIQFNSPDLTRDHLVNLSDLVLFNSRLYGVYDYDSDLFWDGVIDLSDLILLGRGICGPAKNMALMPAPPSSTPLGKALPSARVGVFFDQEGSLTSFAPEIGNSVHVYLLLFVDHPTTVGGGAWKFDPGETYFWTGSSGFNPLIGNQIGPPGIMANSCSCINADPARPVVLADWTFLYDEPIPGVHDLEILAHDDFSSPVYTDCEGNIGLATALPPATLILGTNMIGVDPDPDILAAPWRLTGPAGFDSTATGDVVLTDLGPGEYTIDWGEVVGWNGPTPDTEIQTLTAGGTLIFHGQYTEIPAVSGSIFIQTAPDSISIPWHLTGPAGFDSTDSGNVVFAEMDPGQYRITWLDLPGWRPPEVNPRDETLVEGSNIQFTGTYVPVPYLTEIQDIDPDQGLQVRVVWDRHLCDGPAGPYDITGYEVYRRIEGMGATAALPAGEVFPSPSGPGEKLAGWDYLTSVPAHGWFSYQSVVPSLQDSTAEGIPWTCFVVRATTDDQFTYFDSLPDSGYSVDNLPPAAPEGLTVAYAHDGNHLSWQESSDEDFMFFRVYRTVWPDCDPAGATLQAMTSGTSWYDDPAGAPDNPWDHCYLVAAVDDAGNEGPWTNPLETVVTGIDAPGLPTRFALHQSFPNPFNPTATIRFDLPRSTPVSLVVYDVSGMLVRRLLMGKLLSAGRHTETWDGRNGTGQSVAAGLYFYRLKAGDFQETKRMVMIK